MGTVDFGPLAEDYHRYRVGYGEEVFSAIARRLDPSSSLPVLDLACGTGLSTCPLRRLVAGPVLGTDVALELLKRAPTAVWGHPIHYVRADALGLPFRERSFQAVTCGQALHWMPLDRVMSEVGRVLSESGWFFAYWKYPALDEPYQRLANEVLSRILDRPVESRYTLSVPPDLKRFGLVDVTEEQFELLLPYTVSEYVGFMRSRRRIRDLAGSKTEEFLCMYEEELGRLQHGADPFYERNIVSLFSGRT